MEYTFGDGRKVPSHFENPIDNLILESAFILNPHFKNMNMTPNCLTFISGVFGILSTLCIVNSNYLLASAFYLLSYIFDCYDGNFARTYDQVTEFGDWFDHVKDNLVVISMLVAVYFKTDLPSNLKFYSLIIVVIFIFLMNIHMGCQEHHYHNCHSEVNEIINKSKTLHMLTNKLKGVCTNNNIKYTRYIGSGTCTIVICIILIIFQYKQIRV